MGLSKAELLLRGIDARSVRATWLASQGRHAEAERLSRDRAQGAGLGLHDGRAGRGRGGHAMNEVEASARRIVSIVLDHVRGEEGITDECADALLAKLCRALGGCTPIRDHCGKPEHDLCAICGTPTPGQARR